MKPIVFFDTEVDPTSEKVLDIGAFRHPDKIFHSPTVSSFVEFLGDKIFLVPEVRFRQFFVLKESPVIRG